MPTSDSYKGYIAWKAWQSHQFGQYTRDDAAYFALELELAGIASLRNKHVFEVGFGNGAFAGWAKSQGGQWAGVEVNQDLVSAALKFGFDAHLASADAQFPIPSHADLYIALDVLEHLSQEEIRSVLRDARSRIGGIGVGIFRAPSGDSPFSGFIFNGDLTHRCLLGSLAIQQLAREADLSVESIRGAALPLRGVGLSGFVRRAGISISRRFMYWLVSRVLIGERDAVVSPNMVFCVRGAERRV